MTDLPTRLRDTHQLATEDQMLYGGWGVMRDAAVEIERLQAIVDKLPTDAEGNVHPPPKALHGRAFYHPEHLRPVTRLFTQLFWWTEKECWGVGSGGWEVPLSECYDSTAAAQSALDAKDNTP